MELDGALLAADLALGLHILRNGITHQTRAGVSQCLAQVRLGAGCLLARIERQRVLPASFTKEQAPAMPVNYNHASIRSISPYRHLSHNPHVSPPNDAEKAFMLLPYTVATLDTARRSLFDGEQWPNTRAYCV